MDQAELRRTLQVLGWPCRELARRLGIGHNLAHDILHGRRPLRAAEAAALRRYREAFEATPLPRRRA